MKTHVRDGIITSSIVIMALGLIGAIIPIDVSAQGTSSKEGIVKIIMHNDFKDPNEKMTYVKHTNNDYFKIKTNPPKEIKAGVKGSFEMTFGDNAWEFGKLNLEYKIEKGPTVKFGFTDSGQCFADSVPGIHVSFNTLQCWDGSPSSTVNFAFKEGGEPPK
jgi:hypothetical protein